MYALADPSLGESATPGKVLNSKGVLCKANVPELNRKCSTQRVLKSINIHRTNTTEGQRFHVTTPSFMYSQSSGN